MRLIVHVDMCMRDVNKLFEATKIIRKTSAYITAKRDLTPCVAHAAATGSNQPSKLKLYSLSTKIHLYSFLSRSHYH